MQGATECLVALAGVAKVARLGAIVVVVVADLVSPELHQGHHSVPSLVVASSVGLAARLIKDQTENLQGYFWWI